MLYSWSQSLDQTTPRGRQEDQPLLRHLEVAGMLCTRVFNEDYYSHAQMVQRNVWGHFHFVCPLSEPRFVAVL